MVWLILIVALIVLFALAMAEASDGQLPQFPAPTDKWPTDPTFDDPIEALLQGGVPEDADRLKEQGVDLGQLGYRPPGG